MAASSKPLSVKTSSLAGVTSEGANLGTDGLWRNKDEMKTEEEEEGGLSG